MSKFNKISSLVIMLVMMAFVVTSCSQTELLPPASDIEKSSMIDDSCTDDGTITDDTDDEEDTDGEISDDTDDEEDADGEITDDTDDEEDEDGEISDDDDSSNRAVGSDR